MKRILLTNAGGRLAIGFARAIRAAEPVHLIGVDAHKFMLQRAEADERYLVPRADEDDYIPVLRSIVDETRPDLLCCTLPAEMVAISAARDHLGTRTFLPRHETIVQTDSKMATFERLRQAGVPVPQSLLINTEADLDQAFQQLGDALWLRAIRGTGGKGSLPVSDFQTAKNWIDLRRGWGSFMAAELLEEQTMTWESIWRRGELIVAQGRKRLYWEFAKLTLSGVTGITGAGETMANSQVDEIAIQAIKALDPEPHGVLCVDLSYDRRGRPNVTEINAGRFLSSGVILSNDSRGVNLPHISVQVAFEEELDIETPLMNPLPIGMVYIRGLDMEPVVTYMDYVNTFETALQDRRASLSDEQPFVASEGSKAHRVV